MRTTPVLPALALSLVLALSGCGDDEPESEKDTPEQSPQAAQASAILDCTTEQGLPGAITPEHREIIRGCIEDSAAG